MALEIKVLDYGDIELEARASSSHHFIRIISARWSSARPTFRSLSACLITCAPRTRLPDGTFLDDTIATRSL
jgi:hypothetical protein